MKTILKFSLIILLPVLFQSCATVFTGTHDTVYINSKPEGAKIIINGIDRGYTPRDIRVQRSLNSKYIRLKKDGYESRFFKLQQEFNMITIVNIFMPWGFAIDAVSGAMFIYQPQYYELELEGKK